MRKALVVDWPRNQGQTDGEPTPPSDEAEQSNRIKVVDMLSKLPPFRATALKLLGIAADSSVAIAEFEKVFRADPSLTTDLLLVANSAAYGPRSRIETIRHAITFLGLERVRTLSSTIAFSYQVRNAPQTPSLAAVWTHSIATAVIAEQLGAHTGGTGMYTGGLMHDLGRLGLLLSAGPKYADALALEFNDMAEAIALETATASMTHCQAGAILAQTWHFPENLRSCIAEHHDALEKHPDRGVRTVQLACQLADVLGFPEVCRRDIPEYASVLPVKLGTVPELHPDTLRASVVKQLGSFQS